jgi:hypothetical protein
MSESKSHKRAKAKAPGKVEVKISQDRRLDSASPKRATEIEISGNFEKAVKRLKDSGRPQKVLQTRQNEMPKAVKEMKKQGVVGTVKNMGNTKKISVPAKKLSKK